MASASSTWPSQSLSTPSQISQDAGLDVGSPSSQSPPLETQPAGGVQAMVVVAGSP